MRARAVRIFDRSRPPAATSADAAAAAFDAPDDGNADAMEFVAEQTLPDDSDLSNGTELLLGISQRWAMVIDDSGL